MEYIATKKLLSTPQKLSPLTEDQFIAALDKKQIVFYCDGMMAIMVSSMKKNGGMEDCMGL